MSKKKEIVAPGTLQWEAICQQCGRCCYEKLDYRGQIFYTNKPCPHLDVEVNRCRIYEQRSQIHPDCVHLTPELLTAGVLPADCPYVKGVVDYQAPCMEDSEV